MKSAFCTLQQARHAAKCIASIVSCLESATLAWNSTEYGSAALPRRQLPHLWFKVVAESCEDWCAWGGQVRTAPLADVDWEHVSEGLKTDLAGAFSPEVSAVCMRQRKKHLIPHTACIRQLHSRSTTVLQKVNVKRLFDDVQSQDACQSNQRRPGACGHAKGRSFIAHGTQP